MLILVTARKSAVDVAKNLKKSPLKHDKEPKEVFFFFFLVDEPKE